MLSYFRTVSGEGCVNIQCVSSEFQYAWYQNVIWFVPCFQKRQLERYSCLWWWKPLKSTHKKIHPIENSFQCYPKNRGYCICGQICKYENCFGVQSLNALLFVHNELSVIINFVTFSLLIRIRTISVMFMLC